MRKQLCILLFSIFYSSFAQAPQNPTASEIYESIQKLSFLGSVLYVAAHPDDENTALISYFANDVKARTAYISMTRGDGGQNLIGSHIGELLGVVRSQELLKAREIDGGEQYFSRAKDFGFSKNPTETFTFWDKEALLEDLVFRIRKFQPDIIINRFDHRTPGTTHGHHTASAILSMEAYDLAADEKVFTAQLSKVNPWQAKRLLFNDSWFFYENPAKYALADQSEKFALDIGTYYSSLGLSNHEIAALSRSAHSSQGFGTSGTRGKQMEYLEPLRGGMPKSDLFENIDTSWNRLEDGAPIEKSLLQIQENYDFRNPAASIPDLLEVYKKIKNIKNSHWREIKSQEIKEIIAACAGLYLEAIAESPTAIAGEKVKVQIEATHRSDFPVRLEAIHFNDKTQKIGVALENNEVWLEDIKLQVPESQPPTNPYWLEEESELGMYKVADPTRIGLPETPIPFTILFQLNFNGSLIEIEKPIVYSYTDLAKGALYEPFVIVPEASVEIEDKVHVFSETAPKKIRVRVKSFTENLSADLHLKAPSNWKITPKNQVVNISQKGATQYYEFIVTPPEEASEIIVKPQLKVGDKVLDKQLHELYYDHIPAQKVLLSGGSKFVQIDIQKKGNRIGYIQGAGDEVGEYLKQIGYEVEELSVEAIHLRKLESFDAVVLGIRAFNVLEALQYKNDILFEYVKKGGNVVVQYNVNRGQLVTEKIAPYALQVSTDRVTDEHSKVAFVDENHSVLNYPNAITEKDFEGWVQERGLYFPDTWDPAFKPILLMHDEGEEPLEGSLLVAKYGKGHYVYTGLSFFRELPAGVSGAYRLFANLLSIGKE